jgi:hypothetical protein
MMKSGKRGVGINDKNLNGDSVEISDRHLTDDSIRVNDEKLHHTSQIIIFLPCSFLRCRKHSRITRAGVAHSLRCSSPILLLGEIGFPWKSWVLIIWVQVLFGPFYKELRTF